MSVDPRPPPGEDPRPGATEWEAFFPAVPHPVVVLDLTRGQFESFAAEGSSEPAPARGRLEEFIPDEHLRSRVLAAAARSIETGQRQSIEFESSSPAGRRVVKAHVVVLSREPVARVVWVAHDITQSRDLARRLREREALLETLVESLPFDLWLIGPEGRYTLANSTLRERWGDPIGKRPADMDVSPEVVKTWESNNARALAGEVVRGEVSYHLNGEQRYYVNILAPVRDGEQMYGVVGLNLDVTPEKRLALELERHQRLESVGVLAGGIAHDFNNYLTVILSGLSLLQARSDAGPVPASTLAEMEQAALRARALTRQLLTFARGGAPVKKPTSVGELVTAAAALATHGSSCQCETRIDPELPLVDADTEQLRQVVHNLVLNAVQAMQAGGTVRVTAQRIRATPEGSEEVEIAVCDEGPGIPKELSERVFEPFFTTKAGGHGLGLAISYSIVKKHGGTLAIHSEPGQGTTVFVRLPCSQALRQPEAGPGPGTPGPARILVMDDDVGVRAATTRLLEQLGHRVQVAPDAREMLRLVRAASLRGQRYDTLLFDLTIPGGPSPEEALRQLRELDPSVPVIICSGYGHSPLMAQHREHGFAAVLPKPFTLTELKTVVESVLGHRAPPP